MGLVKRQTAERRWGMLGVIPLADRDRMHNRRCGIDRRKSNATLDDLWVLFPQSPPDDHGQIK